MSETRVMIKSGENLLEGLLEEGEIAPVAAIICHPHPLYGGSMDNGVVLTMQKCLRNSGWSTLRFNFRGVGRSGGRYGEGEGEAENVRAVCSYLLGQGIKELHLGGYSFGAWVALKALGPSLQPASMVLVSPPVDFLEFSGLELPSRPCLITLGNQDDFCSSASLQNWLSTQRSSARFAEVEILTDCDHFYGGNESDLSKRISAFLKKHFKGID